ncbi:MAG: GNAT family N-acetyltransferase [Clostridiales bacterium]|nr:GNAT family N-acetyltransferase [Clostridiales bacterium]
MIRFSRKEDETQIKRLWIQAFGDSPQATDFYFDNRYEEENLLIDTEDGQLRGMLSMLPIQLLMGGQSYNARYFFAIATDAANKRQGISSRLIQSAKTLTKQQGGIAAVLVPANADLFHFYGKRGFETAFYYDLLKAQAKGLPSCPADTQFIPADAASMLRLRDKSQADSRLYVRWDEKALRFIIKASRAWESPLLFFGSGGGEGYAYCEWDEDTLMVKELVLQGIEVTTALAILHSRLQAKHYVLRLPQNAAPSSGDVLPACPYGMISWLADKPPAGGTAPYLGFGKD